MQSTGSLEAPGTGAPEPVAHRAGAVRGAMAPGARRIRAFGSAGRLHTLDSLYHRDFRFLWTSTLATGAGFWAHLLVVGWLGYSLTGSPLMTALLMGIDALPFLVVSPVGGVIADAWDRRKLMVAVSSYQASVTAVFAGLLALGMVGMPLLFGYVLAMGVSWALWEPVRTAVIPTTVPKRSLVNAFALNILAFNGSRLVMPTAAGVVLAAAGPVPVLAAGSVLYLLSAAAATRISPVQRAAGEGVPRGPASQFAEGALFILREPVLLGLMLIVATMVLLLMPVMNGLMPVYAAEVFGVGPGGLGLLMTSLGAGAVVGAVVVASIPTPRNRGVAIAAALGVVVVALIALTRMTSVAGATPILVVMGAALSVGFAIQGAWIQTLVSDELRARVASLSAMTVALYPVGSLLLGGIAEITSVQTATLVAAGLGTALVSAVLFAVPAILRGGPGR